MIELATISPIILASTSPRRHALLNQVNIPHTCLNVAIDETPLIAESPTDYIQRMVTLKAQQACMSLASSVPQQSQTMFVITADTIGVLPTGEILQKPVDFDDACTMWRQMSGSSHEVWTAVQVSQIGWVKQQPCIIRHEQVLVKTQVEFVSLTPNMMANYWQTGEPHDKAGGYAIQGQGAAWVKAINGSYSNVVGLPLAETIALLQALTDTKN